MAIVARPTINITDLGKEIAKLSSTFDADTLEKGFIDGASCYMVNKVKKNFKDSTDAEGDRWLSNAPKTKHGGRFSINYKKRPSGAKVSSSSIRLSDTGRFMKSYRVILKKFNRVLIGPTGARNLTIAGAACNWGNRISPFGEKQLKKLNQMFEKYLQKQAVR